MFLACTVHACGPAPGAPHLGARRCWSPGYAGRCCSLWWSLSAGPRVACPTGSGSSWAHGAAPTHWDQTLALIHVIRHTDLYVTFIAGEYICVCVNECLLLCSLEYASLDDGSLTPALVTAYSEMLYLTPALRPEITQSELHLSCQISTSWRLISRIFNNYRPDVICKMSTRERTFPVWWAS